MTAEVVVVNKSAVALAADSAVTITVGGDSKKTYQANKLFSLSKFHPIGVMVFANSELLGMPWETIVKVYRNQLADKAFKSTREYAIDLFEFVKSSPLLFNESQVEFYVAVQIIVLYMSIKDEAAAAIKKLTDNGQRVTKKQIRKEHESAIAVRHSTTTALPPLPMVPANLGNQVVKKYRDEVKRLVKTYFTDKHIPLSAKARKQLVELSGEIFTKADFRSHTGVVVAGFGSDQVVPFVHSFEVFGLVCDTLIVREDLSKSHPAPNTSANNPYDRHEGVYAFAQTDVVDTLVGGVSDQFESHAYDFMARLLVETKRTALDEMAKVHPGVDITSLDAALHSFLLDKLRDFDDFLGDFKESQEKPLRDVVGFLPINELASLAAALVELTSIKRKMTLEIETVGGPVDVAVISKGDGFVWISRKHYFSQEINPQFNQNYFRK